MSAGFSIAGDVFWGTNGAVEATLETLAIEATTRLGPDAPLAAFFHETREAFFPGCVVALDAWLGTAEDRARFAMLLDAAAARLCEESAFTPYGLMWLAAAVAWLGARIASGRGE